MENDSSKIIEELWNKPLPKIRYKIKEKKVTRTMIVDALEYSGTAVRPSPRTLKELIWLFGEDEGKKLYRLQEEKYGITDVEYLIEG